MATSRVLRDQTINVRLTSDQRSTIDRAAEALGKSRSEFMIDVTLKEARNVLLDQVYFQVDEETFAKIEAILDDPAPAGEGLKRLFASKLPGE
jgi:uncharacterized protein (DUF1778 family)